MSVPVKSWRIVQHIYEGADREPVLTHVFYGETRQAAERIYQAHMVTDAFMRGCVSAGKFRDFTCRADESVEHYDPTSGAWSVA